mmetsp:Transcript_17086/g.29539  ORF Transcript_17086/g.29539 Transcript_17086/m.29539 type:complete len:253 (+) Transcript_17086:79-837(+)
MAEDGNRDVALPHKSEEGPAEVAESSTADASMKLPGRAPKRARYNDKSFGELSVNELEGIVQELNTLKRQCAKKDEEQEELKELRAVKSALSKQVRELERQLDSSKKEVGKLQEEAQTVEENYSVQADRVKKAIKQALLHQLTYQAAFKEKLEGPGREVYAIQANVSSQVLKELGLEHGSQRKFSDAFFGEFLSRVIPNGKSLRLARMMEVTYYKTTGELRIYASYTFESVKKNEQNLGYSQQKFKQQEGRR